VNLINKNGIIGNVVHCIKELDSTNAEVHRLFRRENTQEGLVVWADKQRKGRGQAGNVWQSTAGLNITFSVLLKPTFLQPSQIFALNIVASLAIQRVLQTNLPNKNIQVKWPNDIICEEGKIAGILIENSIVGHGFQYSVIGIGLNVNQVLFPDLDHAISMKLAEGIDFNREKIFIEITQALDLYYAQLQQNGFNHLMKQYITLLLGFEENKKYKIGSTIENGVIKGITPQGHLLLSVNDKVQSFQYKEVELLLD